jgi:hypothetical protein
MMGRMMVHNLPPYPAFKSIDTKADKKRVARMDSHKLDYVSKEYGFGGKMQTGGIELWWQCLDMPGYKKANPKAQKKMKRYCERDVIETEKVYLRERPYYKNSPALNLLDSKPENCPTCGKGPMISGSIYTQRKKHYANNINTYQYVYCRACTATVRVRVADYRQSQDRMKFVKS